MNIPDEETIRYVYRGGWEPGNRFAIDTPTLSKNCPWANPYRRTE